MPISRLEFFREVYLILYKLFVPIQKQKTLLISDKYRFIFIHNPKCAGTSIFELLKGHSNFLCRYNSSQPYYYLRKFFGESALLCNFGQHASALELKKKIPEYKWNSYYKFGIVRNPYSRAVSFFYHIMNKPQSIRNELFRSLGNLTNYAKYLETAHFKDTQHYYFTDGHDHLMVDKILKFENLSNEFPALLEHLELPSQKLPVINQAIQKRDYRNMLNADSLKIFNEIYHKDFLLFDYKKLEVSELNDKIEYSPER